MPLLKIRTGWGFALALALLVAIFAGQYSSTTELISTSRRVTNTHSVIYALKSLTGGLEAMESDLHGYLLVEDQRYLDDAREAESQVHSAIRQARELTADNPGQQRRLDELEPAVSEKLSYLHSIVAIYHRLGQEAAVRAIRSGRGEDLMQRVAILVLAMSDEQRALLAAREARAQGRARSTLLFGLIGGATAIALVVSALWAIRRDMARRQRAETALREGEARLQAVLDNTTTVIYLKDLEGRLLLANRRFEELTGKRQSEIVGRMDVDVIAADKLATFRANDKEVLLAKGPLSFERTVPFGDESRTFLSVKCALRNAAGVPYAICGVATDITDRKRAEEETRRVQRFLDSVVENLPGMVFVKDARELRFVRINRAAEELLGYGREELLGKNDYDFFPKPQADFFTARDRQVLTSHSQLEIAEEVISTRAKGDRLLSTKKVPIVDETTGQPLFLLGISEDITERRRAEQQIEALHRVAELRAGELGVANQELEAFSYSVSHDLRAPLRHIAGFVSLLLKHNASQLDETGRRRLKAVSETAQRMGQLIDDLLVFSRMGRAELQRSKVNLKQLVKEVIAELGDETKGRRVRWVIGDLPQVEGDPSMMRLAVSNLVANAIKYTGTREEAVIEIGAKEQAPEGTVVFVKDNGVGFDMQYASKLFGVFQRLHRQEEFKGTGIGLANVQRIVHRHGGKTWAEGVLDQGATFYFSLPTRKKGEEEQWAA
ncbi:MAG TPA: PAS domain-containing protein [Candidatus Eisenbacteria bacterium]|jgi:PAS domain S-box-containing protein